VESAHLREARLEVLHVERVGGDLIDVGAHYENGRAGRMATDGAQPELKARVLGAQANIPLANKKQLGDAVQFS